MNSGPPTALDVPAPWHAELASVPRPGRTRNEDLAAVAGSSAWILDGASLPDASRACCGLDAHRYVQQLSTALAATLDDSSIELSAALAAAISQVAADHGAACSRPSQGSGPSAAVAIARRRGDILDYLVLGDAGVLLDLGGSVECHSDRRLGLVGQDLRRQLRNHLAAGRGYDDPGYRLLINDLVEAERTARNTEGGYWIASLDPDAASHSLTGSVPIGPNDGQVRRAALLSDGASRSVTHLRIHNTWADLLEALLDHGPQACIDAIRLVERADPQGRRFPRTAASDDASVIVLQLVA